MGGEGRRGGALRPRWGRRPRQARRGAGSGARHHQADAGAMTRRELLAWLDTRRPAPPAALRAHLEAQLSDSEERLPDHLAEPGRAMLARVTGDRKSVV